MRRHSSHREHFRARYDDWSAVGKGVGRGASGCGDDETVGLIGGEVFTVDIGTDRDHRGGVALQDGDIVEGAGIPL